MSARYDGEWVLSSLIDDRAERLGDRRAVSATDGDLTYAELRDRAQRVAGALVGLGIAPGDRVATMLPPSLDYLAAWFGVVWAGAVDVPVNVDFKGEFLRHVVGGLGGKGPDRRRALARTPRRARPARACGRSSSPEVRARCPAATRR